LTLHDPTIGPAQVSKPVHKGLKLQAGASLEIRITQPCDFTVEIRAIVPIRKDGRIRLYPQVLDTRTGLKDETELWVTIAELAQSRLCDAADRAEIEGG